MDLWGALRGRVRAPWLGNDVDPPAGRAVDAPYADRGRLSAARAADEAAGGAGPEARGLNDLRGFGNAPRRDRRWDRPRRVGAVTGRRMGEGTACGSGSVLDEAGPAGPGTDRGRGMRVPGQELPEGARRAPVAGPRRVSPGVPRSTTEPGASGGRRRWRSGTGSSGTRRCSRRPFRRRPSGDPVEAPRGHVVDQLAGPSLGHPAGRCGDVDACGAVWAAGMSRGRVGAEAVPTSAGEVDDHGAILAGRRGMFTYARSRVHDGFSARVL